MVGSAAYRVDPDSNDIEMFFGLDSAYTYSDMTGVSLAGAGGGGHACGLTRSIDPRTKIRAVCPRSGTLVDVVSDRELVAAWKAGDAAAGDTLFTRHFDGLYRFFRNKLEGPVDDLIQRTFLACLETRDAFRGDSTFRTYMFAVARRELYAHFRARKRDHAADIGDSSIRELGISPSEAVALDHDTRVLLRALQRIPLNHQIILELYYWEKLTAPALAEVFGVAEGTIRSRIRYAKDALRATMLDLGERPATVERTLEDFDRWASAVRALDDANKK